MNKILAAWAWNGPVSEPIAYGEGHINQTYALTEQATQKRYILQKINTDTFKDPDGLMENICGVTDFLREKAKQRGADPERATLHVALTKAGKPYYKAADGGCWRVYDFVENTVCLQQVQSSEDFYQSAVAFGNFQHQLADYPANTLHETNGKMVFMEISFQNSCCLCGIRKSKSDMFAAFLFQFRKTFFFQ